MNNPKRVFITGGSAGRLFQTLVPSVALSVPVFLALQMASGWRRRTCERENETLTGTHGRTETSFVRLAAEQQQKQDRTGTRQDERHGRKDTLVCPSGGFSLCPLVCSLVSVCVSVCVCVKQLSISLFLDASMCVLRWPLSASVWLRFFHPFAFPELIYRLESTL